jgi:hypothetical protein
MAAAKKKFLATSKANTMNASVLECISGDLSGAQTFRNLLQYKRRAFQF